MTRSPSNLTRLILLTAILLLTAVVRVYHIDQFSFWIDESLTPLRASYTIPDIFRNVIYIQDADSIDTNPPLYFLLIHFTLPLFGESDLAYRYPSALLGVLLVPVIYRLGRRLFPDTPAVGLTAALFLALNPLHVWYAQEARMYTLFVLWGGRLGLCLWRAFNGRPQHTLPWAGAYAAVAAAAVYTHYTAVFLIAFQAPVWAWLLWRAGYKKWLLGGAGALSLAAVPLIPYTVPRLFTGAESGFVYRSPLVILEDMIGGFGLGLTALPELRPFLWWGMALLLTAGFAALVRRRKWKQLTFLAIYLFAPLVGIAVASLLKPMYQGARHIMLGSPAYLLLIAYGAWAVWPQRRAIAVPARTAALAVVLLAGTSSLYNLYTNHELAKDDLRGAVEYIEANAGTNDAVVYAGPISRLVHLHYAARPELPVTTLPVYPDIVRDDTLPLLQQLARDHDRVWFVPMPSGADYEDDRGLVHRWIDDNLTQFTQKSFTARSTELKVEGHTTRPLTAEPPAPLADPAVWTGFPTLTAVDVTDTAARHLWLAGYWRGTAPAAGTDGWIRFRLRDAISGQSVAEMQQPLWPDPAALPWESGSLRLPVRFPLPLGVPPGEYTLEALAFDHATAAPLGDWQPAGIVSLPPATAPAPFRPTAVFDGGLQLADLPIPPDVYKPGHQVVIPAVWWTAETIPDPAVWQYQLQIFAPQPISDEAGSLIYDRTHDFADLTAWPTQTYVRRLHNLRLPPDAPPGTYELRWRVLRDGQPVNGRAGWWPLPQEWISVGQIEVEPWPLTTAVPAAVQTPLNVSFGPEVSLRGYTLTHTADTVAVDLVWQTEQTPLPGYLTFVHLVDAQTGEIVRQQDWIPAGGLRPTAGWRAGEIIIDEHLLPTADLPPGTYRINVGLYTPDTGFRPQVIPADGEPQPDNQLFLEEIVQP